VGDLSRTRLQKLIREGKVLVDDRVITKPAFKLEGNEIIELNIPEPKLSKLTPENIPLDVIFENQDVIVLNKVAGIVVHPSIGHSTGTLVHAVLAHAPDISGIGGERRPGVVHRLDRDTSGIIVMAKNDVAFQMLQKQFSERTVQKTYLALVDEKPPTPSGRIEAAIGRDPHQRQKMAVMPASKGREAISIYKTIESFDKYAYLEVRPITGRTHQIRVHLAFIGCPVVGDKVYGRKKQRPDIKRQFLHATELIIEIPGQEQAMIYHAPLPPDLQSVLESIR
jgi:23S rRNA pseudouridine1911/1915/1917 synthase